MPKRKRSTKTRTVYRTAKRSYRRKGSKLNASVKKKTAAIGAAAGLALNAAPIFIKAVQARSTEPITSGFTNMDNLVAMGKDAVVGFAAGYAGGLVVDKVGLKKPVNKLLKFIGM